ncbi:DUF1318 domain-containing protein [Maridesulfovibrio salexigens]|uniref:DUF1318 domain-containing protein n=1 Tax=Maridesulfovibrio salexigens (strain ATCC 14822 / DSM 2638 / NCIMB 8403 / VKM B-1763) TaxID=526222 RepID=C6C1K5_MARSD|nr:DUF1318 domain-containing protein [Maridesulfovibrio salexigens]ACS81180.1 conserved hypothetical protein [Maridesulfovibrio salexigens DSM 2638]
MLKKTAQVLTFISLLSFVACVTVNIYFPAAKVERAAEDIVEDVYGTNPKQDNKDDQSALESFLALLTPQAAHAQVSKAEIDKKSNAAIRGLKQSIAADHKKLVPYYNSGNIGITKDGYLKIISKDGLNIKQTADLRRIVSQDNDTRDQLYSEVAASMNIPGSELAKVKAIFAQEWQERAPSGWFIQNANGKWMRK